MTDGTVAETLLRRDRLLIAACLGLICLLSWHYLLVGAGTGMNTLAMTTWTFLPPVYSSQGAASWDAVYWLVMLFMWWIMMIAMMIPSAAPMILLYARVCRHHQPATAGGPVIIPSGAFLLGYLLAWLLFSLLAAVLQWGLERIGLMHGMMMWSSNHTLSAAFLLAAGVYQLSPLKNLCLEHCRSPAEFLSAHWRKGRTGALRMGIDHGLYCVGCCWFLMLLLFVGGIMNLVWIMGLGILVVLEKLLPSGVWFARFAGVSMLVIGVILFVSERDVAV